MYVFFKVSFMTHFDFAKWSQNQHFLSTLLVEREGGGLKKKSSLWTLLIMLTILDDPLYLYSCFT